MSALVRLEVRCGRGDNFGDLQDLFNTSILRVRLGEP